MFGKKTSYWLLQSKEKPQDLPLCIHMYIYISREKKNLAIPVDTYPYKIPLNISYPTIYSFKKTLAIPVTKKRARSLHLKASIAWPRNRRRPTARSDQVHRSDLMVDQKMFGGGFNMV